MTLKSYKSDPCTQKCVCVCVGESGDLAVWWPYLYQQFPMIGKHSRSLPSLWVSLLMLPSFLWVILSTSSLYLNTFPLVLISPNLLILSSKFIFKLHYFSSYYICICKFILETVVFVCYSLSLWFQTKVYNCKASSSWIDIIICNTKNNTSILNIQRAFCGLWMVLSSCEYASKNTEAQGILFSLKVKWGFR